VFYVQYAHARIRSVQRNALDMGLDPSHAALLDAPVGRLEDAAELALIKQIALLPRTLEAAAASHEPHRIAFYLYDLAGSFHVLWNRGKESPELRFLRPDDPELTRARLALLAATQIALTAGLDIMGVVPVEEMI
jgi:arginyl-tRNA synthetase